MQKLKKIYRRLSQRLEARQQSKRIRGVLQRLHTDKAVEAWKVFENLGVWTEEGFYRFNEFEKRFILEHIDPHRSMRSGVCSCGASAADLHEFGRYPCVYLVGQITQLEFYDIRNGGTKLMAKTEGEVLLRFV